jgi:thiol-disulfide isomerase/thioredoxin
VTIHLRGVYETRISLLPLSGSNALKPIIVVESIRNGSTSTINIPPEELPGEFVVRFDYKEIESGTPYPSEKRIIVGSQNLEMWVHPIYCNNPDSTWFQPDEKENSIYAAFNKENARQKQMLGMLQNFLLNYDDPSSDFFQAAVTEYEKRRIEYNSWIDSHVKKYQDLFVSNTFGFQKVPEINWEGSDSYRKKSFREHYLEVIDFSKPLIIRTSNMKSWMDGYVNLYGELATTNILRDSLFTLAGRNAIEAARKGDPLVYGWMVDYFFNGYESFNIEKGIRMLEPYLNDPSCLTCKRTAINKRLKGMESMVPGTIAPDINMIDSKGNSFVLSKYSAGKSNMLLLFWSADCSHCKEMTDQLAQWYNRPDVRNRLEIIAISIDETEAEIKAWQNKIPDLNGWTHLRATDGIRSKAANDYYILSVPVMILVDAKTKKIIALPETLEQLSKLLGS